MLASHRGGCGSIPDQIVRDSWWMKWYWLRLFCESRHSLTYAISREGVSDLNDLKKMQYTI